MADKKKTHIVNGYVHYVKIKDPGTTFSSNEKQYECTIEMDKKAMKEFKKVFPANAKGVKEHTKEEFIEKFKVEPQYDGGEDDEHYTVVVKQPVLVGGKPLKRPVRVLMKSEESGKLIDITQDKEVGNGSKAAVQLFIYENAEWKTVSAKLQAIRVDELVEFEGGGSSYDELGDVDESSFADPQFDEGGDGVEQEPDFGDESYD